jgi:hypothetical protein
MKNYQHFDDVIDKVDNPDNQLEGFAHYISENYKFTQSDYYKFTQNDYHNCQLYR